MMWNIKINFHWRKPNTKVEFYKYNGCNAFWFVSISSSRIMYTLNVNMLLLPIFTQKLRSLLNHSEYTSSQMRRCSFNGCNAFRFVFICSSRFMYTSNVNMLLLPTFTHKSRSLLNQSEYTSKIILLYRNWNIFSSLLGSTKLLGQTLPLAWHNYGMLKILLFEGLNLYFCLCLSYTRATQNMMSFVLGDHLIKLAICDWSPAFYTLRWATLQQCKEQSWFWRQ